MPCPHRGLGQGRVRATACLHGSAPRPGPGPRPGPARRATCSPVCGAAVRQRAGTLRLPSENGNRPSAAENGGLIASVSVVRLDVFAVCLCPWGGCLRPWGGNTDGAGRVGTCRGGAGSPCRSYSHRTVTGRLCVVVPALV